MHAYKVSTPSDTERIMEIVADAKQSLAIRGIDQWQRGYPNSESIASDSARGVGRVIVVDAKIATYGALIFDGEPAYRTPRRGEWLSGLPYAVVHRLCTANEFTRRGLAAELLTRAEEEARAKGFGSFRIDTHPENLYMRQMLPRLGFVECCEVWIESLRIGYEKILR